ncbi:gluconate 2-dehydrogenase subunit 3 family protein [Aliiglaciecola sp. 3_MG-2023]|uniref:gluconate 2-dehydrogenase subunit 3 family protein n=1 Tax=Aliiglaciecola sp. 3_MG-2023 TaxID=3062644 RepID=UPI0026E33EAA|nr:gluconate 2-dehydrogenase subunit 3 family protein [Aliiglaciecola sp. 3_MG-2023]MDO6694570.1 gluconate 2-dehydrogenase subunit 3 family protein [Aliiglaciecola sp. 3_MG-2023]
MKPTKLSQPQRRKFMQHLVRTMGVTSATALVYGSNLNVALGFQIRAEKLDAAGLLFDKTTMQTLKHIVNTILPRTDTPSGADLDCHGFVDHQLFHCHSKSEQQVCLQIITQINDYSLAHLNQSFPQLNNQQQVELLQSIEAMKGFTQLQRNQFKFLKSLIVFGYFTSEQGAKEILRYDPVPGGFSVIPLQEGDKSWGSLAYY